MVQSPCTHSLLYDGQTAKLTISNHTIQLLARVGSYQVASRLLMNLGCIESLHGSIG
jgi:hypothetical protein